MITLYGNFVLVEAKKPAIIKNIATPTSPGSRKLQNTFIPFVCNAYCKY